jgi:hypothetical protein
MLLSCRHSLHSPYIVPLFDVRDLQHAYDLDGLLVVYAPQRLRHCLFEPLIRTACTCFLSSHLCSPTSFALPFLRFLLIPLPQPFHALLANLGIPCVEPSQFRGLDYRRYLFLLAKLSMRF